MSDAARAWVMERYVDEHVLATVAGFYLGMLLPSPEVIRAPS
jgi:hypothetical protein